MKIAKKKLELSSMKQANLVLGIEYSIGLDLVGVSKASTSRIADRLHIK